MIGKGPMATVTLEAANTGDGPEMPASKTGRNMKCSLFANEAIRKNKKAQLVLMAKCMAQDCEQSMEADVGCQYVTPGPGFCYTNPGQKFCKENPSSPGCVDNFLIDHPTNGAGGKWSPVKNFPFVGDNPETGGIEFNGKYKCVCAQGCSYWKSAKALRCANDFSTSAKRNKIFVGGRGGSAFDVEAGRLNPKKGNGLGIVADSGKKDECACVCGKGDEWKSNAD